MAVPGPLSARISAGFATLLAFLIPWLMGALATGATPHVSALAAIGFSAWVCGTGPAIASLAISLLTINYGFIPVAHSSQVMRITDLVNLLTFLCVELLIIAIGESTHREWDRLQSAATALEQKVRERTDELDHANLSLRRLLASPSIRSWACATQRRQSPDRVASTAHRRTPRTCATASCGRVWSGYCETWLRKSLLPGQSLWYRQSSCQPGSKNGASVLELIWNKRSGFARSILACPLNIAPP